MKARLAAEAAVSTSHAAVFAACGCGWLRVCGTPGEAMAAASTHRALHRAQASAQRTREMTWIDGTLRSEADL